MRVFVYINTNSNTQHITIHCEKSKVCPHIMQQIISQNTTSDCLISDVSKNQDKSIIQLGKTSNGYWFLVYTNSCECEEIKSEIKQELEKINLIEIETILQTGVFKICNICCF